ncbi:hypothetical protein PNOK_0851700 [Pyrrhoderma noxium]|uniref:Uncharacterized protein n=1 Tax=Pyrrhoderma noxium TaxID=2282107 RepID=A0A286U805_9AGAM|nr:hypothetical protein PNOK_0851700 [Pyrrhoderma noxium]
MREIPRSVRLLRAPHLKSAMNPLGYPEARASSRFVWSEHTRNCCKQLLTILSLQRIRRNVYRLRNIPAISALTVLML